MNSTETTLSQDSTCSTSVRGRIWRSTTGSQALGGRGLVDHVGTLDPCRTYSPFIPVKRGRTGAKKREAAPGAAPTSSQVSDAVSLTLSALPCQPDRSDVPRHR